MIKIKIMRFFQDERVQDTLAFITVLIAFFLCIKASVD